MAEQVVSSSIRTVVGDGNVYLHADDLAYLLDKLAEGVEPLVAKELTRDIARTIRGFARDEKEGRVF